MIYSTYKSITCVKKSNALGMQTVLILFCHPLYSLLLLIEDRTKRVYFRQLCTYTHIHCPHFHHLPHIVSLASGCTTDAAQTFIRRIIFNFPQFPVLQKDCYGAIFLPPRRLRAPFSPSSLSRERKWESSQEKQEGWKLFTEMAYLVRAGLYG